MKKVWKIGETYRWVGTGFTGIVWKRISKKDNLCLATPPDCDWKVGEVSSSGPIPLTKDWELCPDKSGGFLDLYDRLSNDAETTH